MSRKIRLFSFVFVFVVLVSAFLFVVCPTQDAQSGSSSISDAVEAVQDAVDNANATVADTAVGQAIQAYDAASSQ